jgi:hypothetical protein
MSSGAPEKYNIEFLNRLDFFIDDPRPLARNGVISNVLVAKLLKVDKETVRHWRTPGSGHYQKEFAEKITTLQEVIYAGDIKIGQIEKAKGYTQHKFTRELKETGIILPALSKMSVKQLKEYARFELKLKVDPKVLRVMLEYQIRQAAETLKKKELIVVRHETVNMPSDNGAAENVLSNIGDPKNRWNFKKQLEHGVTNDLADLMKEISGTTKGVLPSDDGPTERKSERPPVAA